MTHHSHKYIIENLKSINFRLTYFHSLISLVTNKMVIPLKVDILHGSSVYFLNCQVLGLTIPHSI